MPIWAPSVETKLYQFIARIAARQLGRCEPVQSVYTRRSVACGEVILGRSDIDLHVLIEPLPDVHAEARFLRDFAARYAALKRVLPCLGDCEASTRVELESWYRSRPYTWYRDRGWVKLYGKEFKRPFAALTDGEERDSLLWWFFWAWERLPGFFRTGNVRICCNLFLDMVNAYGLYVGALHAAKRRAEVLQYWLALCPPSREAETFVRGFSAGFRGRYHPLLPWLYGESLKLCDVFSPHVARALEGTGGGTELRCQAPFSFAPRTYLLVDPFREEHVAQALEAMRRSGEVFVTTEKALKLYLYHRNPWEYYTLQASNPQVSLSPPPEEALQQAVRFSLHKEVPRRAGFSPGKKTDRCAAIGRQYAQCRLYVEHGSVATSSEELVQQYRLRYGAWPYIGMASRDHYFLQDYPVVCQTIEEISQQSAFGMFIS